MSENTEPTFSAEVRRGTPTEEELAAVIAVLAETYSGEVAAAQAPDAPRVSAWQESRRGLRQPLKRNIGWGRFSR